MDGKHACPSSISRVELEEKTTLLVLVPGAAAAKKDGTELLRRP
jgi:hypothetical protein